MRGHAGSVRLPRRALPAHGHAQPVAPQHQPQQQLQQRRERSAHMTTFRRLTLCDKQTPIWENSEHLILGTTTCCDSKPRPPHLTTTTAAVGSLRLIVTDHRSVVTLRPCVCLGEPSTGKTPKHGGKRGPRPTTKLDLHLSSSSKAFWEIIT